MKRFEARYLAFCLRESLRAICGSHVKSVLISGTNDCCSVYISECDSMPARQHEIGGEADFDRDGMKELRIYGYLPIKRERNPHGYCCESKDEGTILFEACMRYIRHFMIEEFGVDAHVREVCVQDCEHWLIPLNPVVHTISQE